MQMSSPHTIKGIISKELHLLMTELMGTSQKLLIGDLIEQIETLRHSINSFSFTQEIAEDDSEQEAQSPVLFLPISPIQIFDPFRQIIIHSKSTDVITNCAIKSVYRMLQTNSIFTSTDEIDLVISTLADCRFQVTTDYDGMSVMLNILDCFIYLCRSSSSSLTKNSLNLIFSFVEQDIQQLSHSGPHAEKLEEVIACLAPLVKPIDQIILALFQISDLTIKYETIAKQVALSSLLSISYTVDEVPRILMTSACVLLDQQLSISGDTNRSTLTICLNLFFNLFSTRWTLPDYAGAFLALFEKLLDFMLTEPKSGVLRWNSFEIIDNFINEQNFIPAFFVTFKNTKVARKLVKVLISFCSVSSSVPEARRSAFAVMQAVLDQLVPSQNDPRSASLDSSSLHKSEESLEKFSERFNREGWKKLIDEMEPKDLAMKLFTAPGINKNVLGEFFGADPKKSDKIEKVCNEFAALFDFSNLEFDPALRVFLTSFTISGESQAIFRNMDMFGLAYYKAHPTVFETPERAGEFAYLWLMLHTSLHNKNMKPGERMTLTQFMESARELSDAYDAEWIESIYKSVQRYELRHADDVKSAFQISDWELMMQKSRYINRFVALTPDSEIENKVEFFNLLWKKSATDFERLLERINEDDLQSKDEAKRKNQECLLKFVTDVYKKCGKISGHYRIHSVLEKVIVTLCKQINNESKRGFMEKMSQSALRAIGDIIQVYGGEIQEGWEWFIHLLVDMFRVGILPDEMCTIVGQTEKVTISASEIRHERRHSSSRGIIPMLIFENVDVESDSAITVDELKEIVKECKFEIIPSQSFTFSPSSLDNLMRALIQCGQSLATTLEETPSELCFIANMLTQTAIANGKRIHSQWAMIGDLFGQILSKEAPNSIAVQYVQQRIVILSFNMVTQLWVCMGETTRREMINLLDRLSLNTQCVAKMQNEIRGGVVKFLDLHINSFIELFTFNGMLLLIASTGAYQEVHLLINKFLALKDIPKPCEKSNFVEIWKPLLQTAVMCLSEIEADDSFARFNDVQFLVAGLTGLPAEYWRTLFTDCFFPAMRSVREKNFTFVAKAATKAFLNSIDAIQQLSNFEEIWMALLNYLIELYKKGSGETLETIPQIIANALQVMKTVGVFTGERREKLLTASLDRLMTKPLQIHVDLL